MIFTFLFSGKRRSRKPPESVYHIRSGPRWQLDIWDLIKGQNWLDPCFLLFAAPGPDLQSDKLTFSRPLVFLSNSATAVFTDLCTFNKRTEGAGLIRETSCRRGRKMWKTCRLLNLDTARRMHEHSNWVRGSSRSTGGPSSTYSSVSALLQVNPPSCLPRHSTGNRREEGTNKPGYVTNDKATGPDETDARAGVFGGRGRNSVTSDLGVVLPSQSESDCQSVQGNNGGSELSKPTTDQPRGLGGGGG